MTTTQMHTTGTTNGLLDMDQLRNRHMLVRSPHMAALIRLRGTLLKTIRNFMEAEDFVEVRIPVNRIAAENQTCDLVRSEPHRRQQR